MRADKAVPCPQYITERNLKMKKEYIKLSVYGVQLAVLGCCLTYAENRLNGAVDAIQDTPEKLCSKKIIKLEKRVFTLRSCWNEIEQKFIAHRAKLMAA